MTDDLGAQGGDVPPETKLDLSTCVNPYGPPKSALEALSHIDVDVIKRHPYGAPSRLEAVYAQRMGVDSRNVVATRAASEAISHLARLFEGKSVVLPLPTYTEYVKRFPGSTRFEAVNPFHEIDALRSASNEADVVIFSNPQNPTGRFVDSRALAELAAGAPHCTFVVDESYADFVEDRSSVSVCGAEADNVVTITSPTKFFGLGGIRVGALWTRNEQYLAQLRTYRTTWPVSALEVCVAEAAMADGEWQHWVRHRLHEDAQWLDEWLATWQGISVVPGPLHFRLVLGDVETLHSALGRVETATRMLQPAHGVGRPALRISAPRQSDRHLLLNAH
jgi:histidinol-phosphate/aromatic aminotransferase/cobyric acid decarboxylase-like protein